MDGALLSDTFVELTDTMVAGFDMIDFLHVLTDRSVQLLDVSAAGLLLADPRGELRVVAASSEAARLLELFQIQNDQGPCLDCFRSGRPVQSVDLAAEAQRWPRFAPAAREAGFAAVQALPMRLREQAKGKLAERLGLDMDQAFNLLRDYARTSNRRLSDLAQAFVDGTDTLTSLTAGTSQPRLGGDGHPRRPAARPRL